MSGNINRVCQNMVFEVRGVSARLLTSFVPATYVQSNFFTIFVYGKATEWILALYPNGDREKAKGHMSLYLCGKMTELDDFETSFQFGIRNKTSNYINAKLKKSDWKLGGAYGFPCWISHADLFDPKADYIANGKLTIFCELTITAKSPNEQPKKEGMVNEYTKMFHKESLKDCELHFEDKVLKCHKFVLAARSDVFDNMFSTDMVEACNNKVDITDIDLETMTQLVRFCYGFGVENLDKIAHKLVYAANKYLIMELKELCLVSIRENLSQSNVLRSLIIADRITGTTQLYQECLNLIVSFYHSLADTPEWKKLPQDTKLELFHHAMKRYASSAELCSAKSI